MKREGSSNTISSRKCSIWSGFVDGWMEVEGKEHVGSNNETTLLSTNDQQLRATRQHNTPLPGTTMRDSEQCTNERTQRTNMTTVGGCDDHTYVYKLAAPTSSSARSYLAINNQHHLLTNTLEDNVRRTRLLVLVHFPHSQRATRERPPTGAAAAASRG